MAFKIITANRLTDGEVLYLTATGGWSESIVSAQVAHTADEENRLLETAEQAVETLVVIGPYAMPVAEADGAPLPLSQREKIRAKGPTVRLDLGKQAGAGDQTHV